MRRTRIPRLLGWPGAKPKHLRRYVELYNAKGIHAVTFVASYMDVMCLDMGERLEERVRKLANELAAWLSGQTGRDRFLVFHTFGNTGWLAYGAILEHLKGKQDMLEKIKGCVVDSGADPDIDPKVWAAGFCMALLKKGSSATRPSPETGGAEKGSQIEKEKEPCVEKGSQTEKENELFEMETMQLGLVAYEEFFSYVLNFPAVKERMRKIIDALSTSQPACPQLYLYSSADRVIPFGRVEGFMEEQRRSGKQVLSFNFESSPHVDHFRAFPDLYASQIDSFLKECLNMVRKL